ncbi:FAD binding domain-containing protein [Rhizodiscina lignyota]|uniref:FAD binding domain-containing protein n=1 Tax=Rhizodiscina lignyota TaxID=1504668 RepID=A0A9P4M5D8_9PEZI|nr:FAD binding domain-containing protein [Rhizodiscina lignyota]
MLTTSKCSALSVALPSEVFGANVAGYNASLASYWTTQEQALHPACIVVPSSSSDISRAVKILSHVRCEFAVKSGGHTPFAGAANINKGITIDLSKLNSTTISADRTTALVGPGARWGGVYSTLQALGFTIPGGRDASVGVGGLVIGGGISFYSPRVGLVCDAVINFEVVLASGAIVNANATSNRRLFRALKGGSNNFGIVTRIDTPLIKTDAIWGGFLYTDESLRPTANSFFAKFADSKTYDPYASHFQSHALVNGSWLLILHMAYTEPGANNPAVFQPLLKLPGQSTVRQATHFNLTEELTAGTPSNVRVVWITMTYKNDESFMETFVQMGNETLSPLRDIEGLFLALNFQPLSQIIIQNAAKNGGDALGLDAEDGDLVVINLGVFWGSSADDARIYNTVWKLFEDGKQKAKEMGVWNEYLYLNYGLRHENYTQDVITSYGQASQSMLKSVSKQYDPTGIFQNDVPGGFKLFPLITLQ